VKLSLDLVPRTCWFSNLRSELPATEWDRLRREQYARAGYRCEVCGGVGPRHPVECHEVWNYTEFPGVQHLDGLVSLCPACHEVKHLGLAQHRGRFPQALDHFMRVNDLGSEEALRRVQAAFGEWAERSTLEWDLDVSWLECHGVDHRLVEIQARRKREAVEDDRERTGAAILAAMLKERGPCPDGMVRVAMVHPCGHGVGLELAEGPDPSALADLQALADGSCSACLAPAEEGEPPEALRAPLRPPEPEEAPGPSPTPRAPHGSPGKPRRAARRRVKPTVQDSEGNEYDLY